MSKAARGFVAQAQADKGWRIWDNRVRRWWGEVYAAHTVALVSELNGDKRSKRLTELQTRERKHSQIKIRSFGIGCLIYIFGLSHFLRRTGRSLRRKMLSSLARKVG